MEAFFYKTVLQAFKLFDADGDGKICAEELKNLIVKVGGEMADAEANALINAADLDGNLGIDFTEFSRLWEALHDESEVKASRLLRLQIFHLKSNLVKNTRGIC